MTATKPTFGSLFAGVGGFDMGMEQAGWDCRFQVEWDFNCQTILGKHWPLVPKWGDVSSVEGSDLPPVDCIIFGSPCQDLSVAGKRDGLRGQRSGLFYDAIRIIKEMRDATNGTFPRWAIWENVAGALSSNAGRDFGAVINEMVKAGSVLVEYALLDAQYFGIAQRRKRVFVVACFDSSTARHCPDPLLPVGESLRGDFETGSQNAQRVASVAASVARDADLHNEAEVVLLDGTRVNDVRVYHPPVQTLKSRMGTGGNNVPVIAHPVHGIRRLTPLECERLMGWPDDHTRWRADGTEQADTHRYKQCGNGVASPVARWIGSHVLKAHVSALEGLNCAE
jgi:DNA (cytosine-5)-methyltransferase 1